MRPGQQCRAALPPRLALTLRPELGHQLGEALPPFGAKARENIGERLLILVLAETEGGALVKNISAKGKDPPRQPVLTLTDLGQGPGVRAFRLQGFDQVGQTGSQLLGLID